MAGETEITLAGNLTANPELKFTNSGAAVANFTIANNPRFFDRHSGEWKDGESLFLRCNAWRQLGDHVAESLTKGTRVIVQGRLKQRSFETREGDSAPSPSSTSPRSAQRCATPPPPSARPPATPPTSPRPTTRGAPRPPTPAPTTRPSDHHPSGVGAVQPRTAPALTFGLTVA